jgi:hypothetical protein
MTRFQAISRPLLALGSALAVLAGGAAAQAADGQAGGTYRLSATVPVACWVRPAGTVLAGAGLSGAVVEACNSPGGFTVSATYRPLKSTEAASLTYGDRVISLAKSGEQELRRSNMATIRTVDYRFEEVDLEEPLVLSLVIQPI